MSQEKTSGAKLQKEDLITLDASRANWLMNEVIRYEHDRALVKRDVAVLASHMVQGTFMPEQVTLIVCVLDGETYRMNGQHTSSAVLLCEEQEFPVSFDGVRLHTYVAETMEDMRQLYARLDRGRSRTNAQVVTSLLGGVDGIGDLSPKITKLLPDGLAFWLHENATERNMYAGERAALDVLGEYRPLAEQIGAFLKTLDPKTIHHGHMFRGSVVAALYATFEKDAEAAQTFWNSVARGVGYDSENAPASRLNALLRNTIISGGHISRGQKIAVGAEQLYRSCLLAWNKHREGEEMGQYMRPAAYKYRHKVQ